MVRNNLFGLRYLIFCILFTSFIFSACATTQTNKSNGAESTDKNIEVKLANENNDKKLAGQNFLWSTEKDIGKRYVSLNNVVKEVLEFYDSYKYYYDLTGFDKDAFIKEFDDALGDDSSWIYDVNNTLVFADRTNVEGIGLAICVICIDSDNVHMVIFSNAYHRNNIPTQNRERFEKWFRALLN